MGHRTTASQVHGAEPSDPATPEVWIVEVVRPALVLGSGQARDRPDIERRVESNGLDLDVVVRRSGGGAVYLAPASQVWIDIILPEGDELWRADVGGAFDWLGAVWGEAVSAVVAGPTRSTVRVHSGSILRSAWSERVCFAGLGRGEVTIDGRKAVGLSQRRTRRYSRFQSTALLSWDPARWVGALVEPDELPTARAQLDPLASPVDVTADHLVGAFLRSIARR